MFNLNLVISVVTIVRNDIDGLNYTLASLPSDPRIESILIDGSDDSSHQHLYESFSTFSKCNLVYHKQLSRGIFSAMNDGLYLARGEWVIFMNAGDAFVPDSIEIITPFFFAASSPDSSVCALFFSSVLLDHKSQQLGMNPPFWPSSHKTYRMLTCLYPALFWPCHQSVFFRTHVHRQYPYGTFGIGSDQTVINHFLNLPHLLSSQSLALVETQGVSSTGPSTYSAFIAHLQDSLQQCQPRRFFTTLLKYFLNSLGLSILISYHRRLRYLYIAPFLATIVPHIKN
jgi:hypothetical protein